MDTLNTRRGYLNFQITNPAWLGLLPSGVIALLLFLAIRFERLTLQLSESIITTFITKY